MAHILITGASDGLGAAMALAFARRGHDLSLVARRGPKLSEVADRVRALGARVATAKADVVDPEALSSAVGTLVSELGAVDVLVANAGISAPSATTRFKAVTFRDVMRVNYEGVINAMDTVLPAMLARESGQIVGISSPAGWLGIPNQGAYSASKAAVTTMLEAATPELRPYGVDVTIVHPGFIRTAMTEGVKTPMPFMMEVEDAAERAVKGILAKRRRVDFPGPLVWMARAGAHLPLPLMERLMTRVSPAPKPKSS